MDSIVGFNILASADAQEREIVETALKDAGIKDYNIVPSHGTTPIDLILIVGTSLLPVLVIAINSLRAMFKRGMIVDAAMSGPVNVRSDPAVPRGVIVILHRDGKVEVRDAETASKILLTLLAARSENYSGGPDAS
jgi:pyruvoyl-dependent arginine decarboxylase (PvlArgDC)